MGRVTTNSSGLAYTREASLGVLPGSPTWKQAEPNNIGRFGASITKVARSPISRARQRRKGVVTDLNSSVEFDCDLTLEALKDHIEGFFFSRLVGPDAYNPSAVVSDGYTVAALSAAQAGRITYGASAAKTLIYARGFLNAANNGLYPVAATVATSATKIPVASRTAETPAASRSVEVAIAGVRGAAGDLEINSDGNLVSTVLDFTTLGLYAGQYIHIGGADTANQFFEEDNYGFARIAVTPTAHLIVLEKRGQDFVTDDGTDTNSGGTGLEIDILFGQFCRNVDVGHADYLEASVQFELSSPNLGTAGATNYEYALGNYCDAMSIVLNLTDKATMTFGFIGTDTTDPTSSRATNAADAKVHTAAAAFSTAGDLARLRLQDVDETGLSTDFKSLTLTVTNNVSPEKVIGRLGAAYMNVGNYEVDLSSTMLFSNPLVPVRMRNNTTVGLDFAVRNAEGGVYFDIPSGELDGGERSYPVNQSVTMNTTLPARKDDILGYSLSASFFPFLPQAA